MKKLPAIPPRLAQDLRKFSEISADFSDVTLALEKAVEELKRVKLKVGAMPTAHRKPASSLKTGVDKAFELLVKAQEHASKELKAQKLHCSTKLRTFLSRHQIEEGAKLRVKHRRTKEKLAFDKELRLLDSSFEIVEEDITVVGFMVSPLDDEKVELYLLKEGKAKTSQDKVTVNEHFAYEVLPNESASQLVKVAA